MFVRICWVKLSSSDNMCELKYNANEKSAGEGDNEKTDQPLQPTHHDNGDHHIDDDKQNLRDPKNKMFFECKKLSFVNGRHFAAAILLKILVKYPCKVRDAIKNKSINMLKTVVWVDWLAFMQPHKRFHIYIGIHSFYVGIGVMINVMFYFPIVRITSKYIQKISRSVVKPRMFWKALMASFMHDIETNNGEIDAQYETKKNGNKRDRSKKDNGYINAGCHQNKYGALKIKPSITGGV